MKTAALLFFGLPLLFITFNSNSQKDYKHGIIIKNNNDTVNGLISLKSNYQNGRECEFKRSSDTASKYYTPDDIKVYKIDNGKYYISKNIVLNEIKRKVFLECLVHGIVDLYYLKDLNEEYFFIEKDTTLLRLSNEQKIALDKYGGKYLRSSNQYIGVLTYIFQNSPEILAKINNTRFEYKSLIHITKEYHNAVCKDYNCIDYTKATKLRIWLEPSFAVIHSRLGLKSSNETTTDTKPAISINFRFKPVKIQYVWNFLLGVNYSANYFNGDFYNNLWDGSYRMDRVELEYSIFQLPIMFEYTFPIKKIEPFLSVGYNICFISKPKSSVREIYKYTFADTTLLSGETPTDFEKLQNGFTGGAGIRYKLNDHSHIFLKTEFEYRNPLGKFGNFLDYHFVKSYWLSFGYGFCLN